MPKRTILIIGLVLLVLFSLFVLRRRNNISQVVPGNDVIAEVGREKIYQKDLDTELSYYPEDPEAKAVLLQKMITDSVILQGASDENLIDLDQTVFNSLEKDYLKRIEMVSQAKRLLSEREDMLKGKVVAIWFFNNDYIGPLGYERGKQIAFEKLSELQKRVVDGTVTIDQAGEIIKNDKSLEQLDPVYKNNALYEFNTKKSNPQISLSTELDNELWSLEPGGVSKVYIAKTKDAKGQERESLYLFGQVLDKRSTGTQINIDDWVNQKKQIYAIVLK